MAKKTAPQLLPGSPPLGIPTPVVGATGPHGSGKSLFGLSLAPGVHPEGHEFAGKSRTLCMDFEFSNQTTFSGTGAELVDVPKELRAKFGSKPYTSLDIFNWFRSRIQQIPPGRYDVIMADPVTDIEDGLVDHVRRSPGDFGYSAAQFEQASGIMWGCVKQLWKLILTDLAARCQIFYFVAHERMEFKGGRPTGRKIPKGKETLEELASLYLCLAREKPSDAGKPQPPSAEIIKERLSLTSMDAEGNLVVTRILPLRLPVCDPKTIRYYVANPVGDRKLKPEEMIQEKEMSEDERRILDLEIAQAQERAATATLSRTELMVQAAQRQAEARAKATGGAPLATTVAAPAAPQTASPLDTTPPGPKNMPADKQLVSEEIKNHLIQLGKEVFGADKAKFLEKVKGYGQRGGYPLDVISQIREVDARDMIGKLNKVLMDRAAKGQSRDAEPGTIAKAHQQVHDAEQARLTANPDPSTQRPAETAEKPAETAAEAPFDAPPAEEAPKADDKQYGKSGTAIPEPGSDGVRRPNGQMLARLEKVAKEVGFPQEKMDEYCKNRGCTLPGGLTFDEVDNLLDILLRKQLGLNKVKGGGEAKK